MNAKKLIWVCLLAAVVSCDKTELVLTVEEQLAKDITAIDEYLAANGITAVQHPSGLRYVILAEGTGAKAASSNCVRITFEQRVLGEVTPFDNSSNVGVPISTRPVGVQIGLKQIAKGGVMTMYIPSKLAYGTYDVKVSDAYTLPMNSIIKYDVELVNLTGYNSAGQYCYPWP